MQWLDETNRNNRKVRQQWVDQLADDMLAGRWRGQNGEAIRFDTTGRLVDGQHRLWACVQSGTAFETLVVTGVDIEDFKTIGIGGTKRLSDFLGPIYDVKNVNLYSSTLRLVHIWRTGRLKPGYKSIGHSISELEASHHDHPQLQDSVNWVTNNMDLRRLLNPTYASFIHYVAYLDGKQAAVESFLSCVGNGLGLLEDHPVYQLRKFLLSQQGLKFGQKRPGREYMLALLIKAWNAHKNGEKTKALVFKVGETFPEVV